MKFDNYKDIKKSEWQKIATDYGIKWDENSVVRYLVEKIAEKIGADDKIVSDNELKKKVIEVINANFEANVPVEKPKATKKTTKKETKKETKTTTKKVATPKEPVIAKVVADAETITAEIPAVPLSRLEQLRLECESYGIAWTDKHSEANLEQVLNGVKNAGIQPTKPIETIVTSNPTINTTQAFEINSANATDVANSVANMPTNNAAFNPLALLQIETPVNGGYKSTNAYLNTYSSIYLNAIRGHWRLLSVAEINEMINRDKQSFTYTINHHPQQLNKIEILLVQDSDKVRVPSNETEWIYING